MTTHFWNVDIFFCYLWKYYWVWYSKYKILSTLLTWKGSIRVKNMGAWRILVGRCFCISFFIADTYEVDFAWCREQMLRLTVAPKQIDVSPLLRHFTRQKVKSWIKYFPHFRYGPQNRPSDVDLKARNTGLIKAIDPKKNCPRCKNAPIPVAYSTALF